MLSTIEERITEIENWKGKIKLFLFPNNVFVFVGHKQSTTNKETNKNS